MGFRTAYGYTYSENGWRMCNRDECDIVRIKDLFLVDTAPLRKGAPLTILGAWLKWYDTNVEEIGTSVWGWSRDNDVANSNHLSGTAVDVNAPKYPWGARVMPAGRIAKIREGLRLFEGSVFWGADWQRADEMHYQMAWKEGDQRNDVFAAKLRAGHLGIYTTAPTPTPKPGGPSMALPVDRDIRAQLTGSPNDNEYPGFEFLGGRTTADALGAIGAALKIPGFRDPKAGK
ncbi:M15 family metallopeptidase [Prescottella equi]|uniref:M15 family metallopeptidase n=1 Tax=Rhodococcus hoagii TaxID=43767 RepID=UPI00197E13B5|nr:M15 family metallopeptidase [Prescottella equi]NKU94105.1 M15 family peptidase [Prescottella equi]NKW33813.1 M15 family peptidase [Prescottella equi]